MSQLNQTLQYEHIKDKYSKRSSSQIIDRLIQQMQINYLKSKSILKLEKRILQLEDQTKSKGINLTQTKVQKLHQLKQAYQLRNSSRGTATPRESSRRQSSRTQTKYKNISPIRNPERDEVSSPFSGRHRQQLMLSLKESTKTIAQLFSKNQILQNERNQLLQNARILIITQQSLKCQVKNLELNRQELLKEINEVTLDNRYLVGENKKNEDLIQKLLRELEQFKDLDLEKSEMIEDIKNKNSKLEENIMKYVIQINSYTRSIDDYEKKTKELVDNQGEYEEQIKRLEKLNVDNQYIIYHLGIQNDKQKERLQQEIKNCNIMEQVINQMRLRTQTLQKKILKLQQTSSGFQILLKEKNDEIGVLSKSLIEREDRISKSQFQNKTLKHEFIMVTQQFKDQINSQLKLISGYQKIQKPKQLSALKQKFKGDDKYKQFKLYDFHMRMNIQKPMLQENIPEKNEEEEKSKRLKSTSQGLRELVVSIEHKMNQLLGTHNQIKQKTQELNKKIPEANH